MTFAWYAHLRAQSHKPWIVAALLSWGIAFFKCVLQVPGNRIGYTALTVSKLNILQEVITLTVLVPFAVSYLKASLKLDYLWGVLHDRRRLFHVPRPPRRRLRRVPTAHALVLLESRRR